MNLKSTWNRIWRKFNKPSSDARRIEVPADQIEALLSLREKYDNNASVRTHLELDKFAHQICPALAEWDGADWYVHVSMGKLWLVEDV